MVYGIYQSAAGLQVNQYRQSVVANNLANVDTVGFKQDLAILRERRVASRSGMVGRSWTEPVLDRMTGGIGPAPTVTSFTQGTLKETGSRLDVALADRGFFAVSDGEGVRYTRDGRFAVNADNELVTAGSGHLVLDEDGQSIVVPKGARKEVRIEASGEVRVGETSLGRLGIVDFEKPQDLRKIGGNLFDAGTAEAKPTDTHLRVSAIEMANVDATQSMVSMLQVSRAYEMNATMVSLADATLGRAVNDIARLR